MGEFEAALKLATSYERLACAGKASIMRGDIWTEYAQQRQAIARADHTVRPAWLRPGFWTLDKVYEAMSSPASAYLWLKPDRRRHGQANCLWLSTHVFLSGRIAKATSSFEQLQQVDAHSPHLGEGWYLLG